MVKPYGLEYIVSVILTFVVAITSAKLLKRSKQIYKNLLLNFLAYFMLFNNAFYFLLKYNWNNLNLHITYVILSIVCSAMLALVAYFLEKFCKNEKTLRAYKSITSFSIIILQISLMVNQAITGLSISFFGHLCNQISWLLALTILVFPNTKLIHYTYYAALIGSVISFVYPATLNPTPSVLHFDFFRNLYGHGALIWASLFMWLTEQFKLSFKKLWVLPVGLCISFLYAHIANVISYEIFNKTRNYLFLNNFPIPYLNAYICAIFAVAGVYLFVYLYEKFLVKKKN